MFGAMGRFWESINVQLAPSVDWYEVMVSPERTRRTQAFGKETLPAVVADVAIAVWLRFWERIFPSEVTPIKSFLEPEVRASRIIRPMTPFVPVFWTEARRALISPSLVRD